MLGGQPRTKRVLHMGCVPKRSHLRGQIRFVAVPTARLRRCRKDTIWAGASTLHACISVSRAIHAQCMSARVLPKPRGAAVSFERVG